MFLKRLETVGFKSFAERISVDFVPGVTAVVGPNGSGKSNIIDAVRWVLGEQSAKSLRGSKMEDIIFQGSDSRKPLNVAEVTLVLDNTDQALPVDYHEVSVTRRVFRSGESEFLINKQSCRLKDIVDLFMDSGLGREAFSIISQGKVEEILSSKAEERRSIFEEAAGVLKYKNRKKKAEYKLAETQENLNRIEDIIYEIENQLEPLKEQAAVAKDYLEKKDRLKEREISLLIAEIELLHAEWKTILQELESEKEKEIALKTKIQQQEAKLEEERSSIEDLDSHIESLQDSLLRYTQELENLEGKKQLLQERSKHYHENKTNLELEITQLQDKSEGIRENLASEQQRLTTLEAKRNDTKKQLSELNEELSLTEKNIEEQIEELKSDYIERLNEQAAKRNERQSIEKQVEQITYKMSQQKEKFKGSISERDKWKTEVDRLESVHTEAKENYSKSEVVFQNTKKSLDVEKHKYQDMQTKLYQGYQHIEKLKSKKEMLEDMKEDFQGFFYGVKEVLKAREDRVLNDIEGAVIELIQVPDKHITAIETALGGQAQHVVVKDEQAARKAINWLKQTNKGRATFLPLDTIKPKMIGKDLRSGAERHPGFVGIASELLNFNPTYKDIVHHLLGNVVIASTLKDANEIASILQRRFRVVTLDGDVVNPGGSMTGGAVKKNNQSLFTREKDLQDINVKLEDFEKKAVAFERQVNEQKQKVTQLEEQLEEQRETIRQAQETVQNRQADWKEMALKVNHLNDNLSLFDQDNHQYEQELEGLNERDLRLEEELNTLSHMLASIQENIDQLSKQQSEYKENQDRIQSAFHQHQVTLAEEETEVRSQREKVENYQASLREVEESLAENKQQLQELMDMHESGESMNELDSKLEEKQKQKEDVTEQIQTKRQERYARSQAVQDAEREMKEENRLYQFLMQQIQDKEVKSNRLDVELENRLSHLETEYKLTFEKAQQTYEKAEDIEEAKRAVKLIKRAIEELGTVNLGAIDEYDRIEERYAFLSEQKLDLVQAKDTLYGVISEMDEEMKRRFDETFSKIKEEFTIVFQELFGGGRAELKLTDPSNLLDTGVDIIAQPPGKKLQHLGLLSGGERALTAIALLFAILRVRPVPFCILDEVEAALDDANVNRFARYLKVFSHETQFIVITHRKGTMEEADVLYGVTMQELGVSRLVSVRLEDAPALVQA
ncbi:chromosome segregation protein SMC [Radiobacillus kanasensis]|uniref:chromosome segregation protein SMC n=1 Tax=Radiobacillus kanasensis TaxID=2844358 RepID=UPI001E4F8277|nr:chromosome segregation protein SMC [Radiobacillus kanasensis]UFU01365.1 chromosome segregation protein SMC [Radiobacillus kanasensis]